ncbi:MAG: hypothetical protein AAF387_15270 [Pseudomonadota bacterium]
MSGSLTVAKQRLAQTQRAKRIAEIDERRARTALAAVESEKQRKQVNYRDSLSEIESLLAKKNQYAAAPTQYHTQLENLNAYSELAELKTEYALVEYKQAQEKANQEQRRYERARLTRDRRNTELSAARVEYRRLLDKKTMNQFAATKYLRAAIDRKTTQRYPATKP